MSELLVSVRNAAEAEEALAGGAVIIDVKEPNNGSLGPATMNARSEVVRVVAGRAPVSVALGELSDLIEFETDGPDIAYFKAGLAGMDRREWQRPLFKLHRSLMSTSARLVAVGYADAFRADSPSPYDVLEFAIENRMAGFLIDTWEKTDDLLGLHSVEEMTWVCRRCRDAGIRVALAGSLGAAEIAELLPAAPDYFAVRGAACVGGRQGRVTRERVADLVGLLSPPS